MAAALPCPCEDCSNEARSFSLSGLLGSRIIRSVRVIGLRHRTDHDLLGHESRDQRGRGMPVVKTGWREHRSGRVGEHTIRGIMHIVDVRESACAGDHGNALQQPQRRDRRNDDHAGSTDEAPQPHQGHHPHDLWLPPRQQPHRARHAPLRRTRHTPTTTKNLTHENSRSPLNSSIPLQRSHHGIRTPTRVCVHDSSNEPYPPLDGRLQYRDAMR